MNADASTRGRSSNPFSGRAVKRKEEEIEMSTSLLSISSSKMEEPVVTGEAPSPAQTTSKGGSYSTVSASGKPLLEEEKKKKHYVKTRILRGLKPNTFSGIVGFITFILCMITTVVVAVVMREKLQVSVAYGWDSIHVLARASIENYIREHIASVTGILRIEYSLFPSNSVRNYTSYITQACSTLAFNINAGFELMESYRMGSGFDVWTTCYYRRNASEPSGYTMGAVDMFFTGSLRGAYVINQSTYMYAEPLQLYSELTYFMTDGLHEYLDTYLNSTIFRLYNKTRDIDKIPKYVFWEKPQKNPSVYTCIFPLPNLNSRDSLYSDASLWRYNYIEILLNASMLLPTKGFPASSSMIVRYGNWSGGPIVLANSWGQQTTNYSTLSNTNESVTYFNMRVSEITDRVMLAALKHIDVYQAPSPSKPINITKAFLYKRARALVSIWDYNTSGFGTRIVLVNAEQLITHNAQLALDMVFAFSFVLSLVLSVLMLVFTYHTVTRPLQALALNMLGKVAYYEGRGDNVTPLKTGNSRFIALKEVEEPLHMYNKMVRVVNEVEKYVPMEFFALKRAERQRKQRGHGVNEALSTEASHSGSSCIACPLDRNYTKVYWNIVTVVSVSLRQRKSSGAQRDAFRSMLRRGSNRSETDGAPLSTRADSVKALTQILDFVVGAGMRYGGRVPHLSPETLVTYFHPSSPTPSKKEVRRRAVSAMCFALEVQRFFQDSGAKLGYDCDIFVDTCNLLCGRVYCERVGTTLIPVMGRALNCDVGYVGAKIGVNLLLSDATARLVRAHVRVLPLEKLAVRAGGESNYTVELHTAVAGRVKDDVWLEHASNFCRAFDSMLHGDYGTALSLLESIPDSVNQQADPLKKLAERGWSIEDAPRGPRSVVLTDLPLTLRRQRDRLMEEARRHICASSMESYLRSPLSMQFRHLLQRDLTAVQSATPLPGSRRAERAVGRPRSTVTFAAPLPTTVPSQRPRKAKKRLETTVTRQIYHEPDTDRVVVCALPTCRRVTADDGKQWTLSYQDISCTNDVPLHQIIGECIALSGTIAVYHFFPYAFTKEDFAKTPYAQEDDGTNSIRYHQPPITGVKAPVSLSDAMDLRPHANLESSYLLSIEGVVTTLEGGVLVITEYYAGGHIGELVRSYPGGLSDDIAGQLLQTLLHGLHELHSTGRVHGSLRPSNVLVGTESHCKLRRYCASALNARHLLYIRPSAYMSPEEARGQLPTAESDMYCVGLLLLLMLTGKQPWRCAAHTEVRRTQEEVDALVARGGVGFVSALEKGQVEPVPIPDVLPGTPFPSIGHVIRNVAASCLVEEPTHRLTAEEALKRADY